MTLFELSCLQESIRRDIENHYTTQEQEALITALSLLILCRTMTEHS